MTFLDFWQHNIDQEYPPLKAVLFDVDGTVVSGRDMMPGADKVIEFLRKKNTPFLFLTNDGNHSTSQKARRISRAGVEVQPEEIISCSHALSDFVEQNSLAGSKAFVMGELGSPCYAEAAGVIPCRNLEEIDECSFVIAGESYFDWHDVFHGVMNYFITHRDSKLVVPNPDSYWPNSDTGKMGIGAGAQARFIAGLLAEMKINIELVYLGKPYPAIYFYALKKLQNNFNMPELKVGEVLMVGDSLTSDIAGAQAINMPCALVMTGITTPELLAKTAPEKRPGLIFDSLM